MSALAPVVKRIEIAVASDAAFQLFTRQMSRWWPLATYACSVGGGLAVVIDERVGGQIVEQGRDGASHVWGTVTAWDPPRQFAMTWHPKRAAERATHVTVDFHALSEGGCELVLTHDQWELLGDDAVTVRQGYDSGWPGVLERFVAAAAADGRS